MSADPVLEIREAWARVGAEAGGREVVRGVSLALKAGETVAVVGPSGAGKSTLGRLAVGLVPASAGSVWVEGQQLGALRPRALRALRRRMQIVFQDPTRSLDPTMEVAAILAEGVELHERGRFGMAPGRKRRRRELAEHWLPRVGLEASLAARRPASLSGGQRQRVAIARAMALGPTLLVADEPTASLDAGAGGAILDLLAELQREQGTAYLLICHSFAQAARIAHRIAVMDQGRLVELGDRAQVLAAPAHPLTRSLLAAVPPWPPAAGGAGRAGATQV